MSSIAALFSDAGDEPSEASLRAALLADRVAVVEYLSGRIVEAEETVAEGVRDLLAYQRDYDLARDDDVVALWELRFGLSAPEDPP